MQVARLYGPKDIRVQSEPAPPAPRAGEITLNIGTVGLCGSDLPPYTRAGASAIRFADKPFVLGHEFMGVVAALGPDALDGNHQPLQVGQRVGGRAGRALLAL